MGGGEGERKIKRKDIVTFKDDRVIEPLEEKKEKRNLTVLKMIGL